MYRLLNTMGAKCFYATRTYLPKLRFLTENINIHACGGELDGLYTFTRY